MLIPYRSESVSGIEARRRRRSRRDSCRPGWGIEACSVTFTVLPFGMVVRVLEERLALE